MAATDPTINFLYFLYNYSPEDLYTAMQSTSSPDHLFKRLEEYSEESGSGTTGLFRTMMAMSDENKKLFIDAVNRIYSYRIA